MGLHLTRAEAKALGIEVPKRHKYNARKVEIDGWTFDSKAEGDRYAALKHQVMAGMIRNLVIHPRFPIEVRGIVICTYVADFGYIERAQLYDRQVVEDVKGIPTEAYRLKKKLVKAAYPHLTLREVRKCRGSRSSRQQFTTTDV
jgi:hypothetical protein